MAGGGPVANLARQGPVIGAALGLSEILVALDADRGARVPYLPGCDGIGGRGPVVAYLSEGRGHEALSHEDERRTREDEERTEPDDLIGKAQDSQCLLLAAKRNKAAACSGAPLGAGRLVFSRGMVGAGKEIG